MDGDEWLLGIGVRVAAIDNLKAGAGAAEVSEPSSSNQESAMAPGASGRGGNSSGNNSSAPPTPDHTQKPTEPLSEDLHNRILNYDIKAKRLKDDASDLAKKKKAITERRQDMDHNFREGRIGSAKRMLDEEAIEKDSAGVEADMEVLRAQQRDLASEGQALNDELAKVKEGDLSPTLRTADPRDVLNAGRRDVADAATAIGEARKSSPDSTKAGNSQFSPPSKASVDPKQAKTAKDPSTTNKVSAGANPPVTATSPPSKPVLNKLSVEKQEQHTYWNHEVHKKPNKSKATNRDNNRRVDRHATDAVEETDFDASMFNEKYSSVKMRSEIQAKARASIDKGEFVALNKGGFQIKIDLHEPVGWQNGKPTNVIEVRVKTDGTWHFFPSQSTGSAPAATPSAGSAPTSSTPQAPATSAKSQNDPSQPAEAASDYSRKAEELVRKANEWQAKVTEFQKLQSNLKSPVEAGKLREASERLQKEGDKLKLEAGNLAETLSKRPELANVRGSNTETTLENIRNKLPKQSGLLTPGAQGVAGAALNLANAFYLVNDLMYVFDADSVSEGLKRAAGVGANYAVSAAEFGLLETITGFSGAELAFFSALCDGDECKRQEREATEKRINAKEHKGKMAIARFLEEQHPEAVIIDGPDIVIRDQKLWDQTVKKVNAMLKMHLPARQLGFRDGLSGERLHKKSVIPDEDLPSDELTDALDAADAYEAAFHEGEATKQQLSKRARDLGMADASGGKPLHRTAIPEWNELKAFDSADAAPRMALLMQLTKTYDEAFAGGAPAAAKR